MSSVINTTGVTAGCIYRIAVKDFVTYKRIEMFPGPSLNLITGANGTGKSTIVSAIILGLNEKHNIIDTAKKLPDYIRRGCDSATTEIELYRERGQTNVIIMRNFNRSSSSSWYIDHKSVTWKQVQELVASMNIQVANLCQFLPQHRVHDFTALDPQQLFRSTLTAVKGQTIVNQLDELINSRLRQKDNTNKKSSNEKYIQEQQLLNDRLKIKIDAMVDRRNIEDEIGICEKKMLWLQYEELYNEATQYLQKKKLVENVIKSLQIKLAPSERDIDNAKTAIRKMEEQRSRANKGFDESKHVIGQTFELTRIQERKLNKIETSYQNKVKMKEDSVCELKKARVILDKLIIDKRRINQQLPDDAKRQKLKELAAKTNLAIKQLEEKKLHMDLNLKRVLPQISSCRFRIRNLEDVNVKRLNTLRNYSEDTYNAVMWLRENRRLFEFDVHEPMMLEIQFTDPKFARYLESTVSARDLVAFTFEDTDDMNKFLKIRKEKGWRKVNALCSQGGTMELREFPTGQLGYLGFYTYLVNTIIAPNAIVNYLCRSYQIDRIPLGNAHTYRNSGKVPENIRCFYTENHKFSVRKSAYSGEKSVSIFEVRSPRLLANTIDAEEIAGLRQELSVYEEQHEMETEEISKITTKLSVLKGHRDNFETETSAIIEKLSELDVISEKIKLQEKTIRHLETQPIFNIEAEQAIMILERKRCVTKQCNLQVELSEMIQKLQNKLQDVNVMNSKLEFSRRSIVKKESSLHDLRGQLKNERVTLEDLNKEYTRTKSKAVEKLDEAKRSTNNKVFGKEDFPYTQQFEALPNDMTSLQNHCHGLQSRVDTMDPGDEHDIRYYEERKNAIARKKMESENAELENTELEKKMATIKSQWLPSIEFMMTDINRNFTEMFKRLGCAGEIKLENCGTDDYDNYGIFIMVSFRKSDEMQQLTRYAQSGGERTITTALYLMALQRLTVVPFRCMDEINQGMDAENERKMLELMFEVTTKHDNTQCFLLSPNIIRNLPYNSNVVVHTIMNGPELMNYKKWQFNSFLENARAYRKAY